VHTWLNTWLVFLKEWLLAPLLEPQDLYNVTGGNLATPEQHDQGGTRH
jgi:hypothetical protein